jgi:hypothetical protein
MGISFQGSGTIQSVSRRAGRAWRYSHSPLDIIQTSSRMVNSFTSKMARSTHLRTTNIVLIGYSHGSNTKCQKS